MAELSLRIHFIDMGTAGEHARIETRDGWYVCTVEQCSEESRRTFRSRARQIMRALEHPEAPVIHAGGEEPRRG